MERVTAAGRVAYSVRVCADQAAGTITSEHTGSLQRAPLRVFQPSGVSSSSSTARS